MRVGPESGNLIRLVVVGVQRAARQQRVHRRGAARSHRRHHRRGGSRAAPGAPLAPGRRRGRARDLRGPGNLHTPPPGRRRVTPRVLGVRTPGSRRRHPHLASPPAFGEGHGPGTYLSSSLLVHLSARISRRVTARRLRSPLRQHAGHFPPLHLLVHLLRVAHAPRLALQRGEALRGEPPRLGRRLLRGGGRARPTRKILTKYCRFGARRVCARDAHAVLPLAARRREVRGVVFARARHLPPVRLFGAGAHAALVAQLRRRRLRDLRLPLKLDVELRRLRPELQRRRLGGDVAVRRVQARQVARAAGLRRGRLQARATRRRLACRLARRALRRVARRVARQPGGLELALQPLQVRAELLALRRLARRRPRGLQRVPRLAQRHRQRVVPPLQVLDLVHQTRGDVAVQPRRRRRDGGVKRVTVHVPVPRARDVVRAVPRFPLGSVREAPPG